MPANIHRLMITTRQAGLRLGALATRQSMIAVRRGMKRLQSRQTSGLQACFCAAVCPIAAGASDVAHRRASDTESSRRRIKFLLARSGAP